MCEITAQWLGPHFLTCAIILRQGISDEVSRDSSVGIATGYGLVGLGIESWCGRELPYLSRPALGPTQPPVQWVPGFSRG